MILFPAIDLVEGKAVRLTRGDYGQMTVYDDDPLHTALQFQQAGAEYLHMVDLEGARDGGTPNLQTVRRAVENTSLKIEIGGGIRDLDTCDAYLNSGVWRVIIGTAAVTDPAFLREALRRYGEKICVGVDIRDGFVAIKGWLEDSRLECFTFFEQLEQMGVQSVICTDISKDGMLSGSNEPLYRELSRRFGIRLTASGGVSCLEDVRRLADMNLYGAILGKALYEKRLDLAQAIRIAGGETT